MLEKLTMFEDVSNGHGNGSSLQVIEDSPSPTMIK
jgi:hypothetical protein